jgi:hypothetical protein
MGLLVAAVLGLIFWIVAWSLGAKSIDAFLVTAAIFLVAAAGRTIASHLPGNRRDAAERS